MDDEFEAAEMANDSPEFTFAEIIQLEKLFKEMREKPIDEEFFRELSEKFNCSPYRAKMSPIIWSQVQSWFQEKQPNMVAKVSTPAKEAVDSKTAMIKKRVKGATIPASEAAVQLHNLIFEAQSAKDFAWFDVGSFLSYRFLCSGELLVRVRFAGFGKEEDEWVSVRRAVRERSIPLEPSECGKVEIGDLVLCYREGSDHALYCDAHVMKIERKAHDGNDCTCVFAVRYDHDNVEGKVTLKKLCCRPKKTVAKGSDNSKLAAIGMQKALQLFINE